LAGPSPECQALEQLLVEDKRKVPGKRWGRILQNGIILKDFFQGIEHVGHLAQSYGGTPMHLRSSRSNVMALTSVLLSLLIAGPAVAQPPASKNFVTHLTGAEEVPERDCPGQGQAIFQLSKDGTELSYKLISSNIENVVAAHIHLAPAGANGNVVLFLFGPAPPAEGRHDGVLGEGTATAADLVGPLTGQPLSALVTNMRVGNAYVNVHTNDGVAPTNTGCGDFPGGEIRGQIRTAGPTN
jgi:hypothetical protein